MKIIGTDNFDRESVADVLVCENIANGHLGEIMLAALNNTCGSFYYKLVPADYKLWRGMEELV